MSAIFSAHGRVNLMGEHTDYNHGFVLPTLIPQETEVLFRHEKGTTVQVSSDGAFHHFELGLESRRGSWTDYIEGITWVLRQRHFALSAFSLRIQSTVPRGAGVSSSAALLVAILRALRNSFGWDMSDLELAKSAKDVENHFVGAQVGIMDPMACSVGEEKKALLIDTEDLSYSAIPLPSEMLSLLVIHSGVTHRLAAGSAYITRRQECEEICKSLGVQSLRQIVSSELTQASVLDPVLKRRVKHVVTENERVLGAAMALKSNDLKGLGKLFQESHRSMSQDYEVSCSEIDSLVTIANCFSGRVAGARLTGGGFGGSVVVACFPDDSKKILELGRQIIERYEASSGRAAQILMPIAASDTVMQNVSQ